jgi:hypothetical protein
MLPTVSCVVPMRAGWAWAKSAMTSAGLVDPSDGAGPEVFYYQLWL